MQLLVWGLSGIAITDHEVFIIAHGSKSICEKET